MKHLTHEDRLTDKQRGREVLKHHQDNFSDSDNQEIKDLLALIERAEVDQEDAYQADDFKAYFKIDSTINDHYELLDWLIANN